MLLTKIFKSLTKRGLCALGLSDAIPLSQENLGSVTHLKRPWLLTPKGQRASLHLANLLSLVLFIGFTLNYALVEIPRQQVDQLDPKNVSYCEISECDAIQGLLITNGEVATSQLETKPFGELLVLDFTNTLLLSGERELWLKVEAPDGRILEMASVTIKLDLKNRTMAEFLLVSKKEAILSAKLSLGY